MIELRSDTDTLPTPPLMFTRASNIAKVGLIFDFEGLQSRNEGTRLKSETRKRL